MRHAARVLDALTLTLRRTYGTAPACYAASLGAALSEAGHSNMAVRVEDERPASGSQPFAARSGISYPSRLDSGNSQAYELPLARSQLSGRRANRVPQLGYRPGFYLADPLS